MNVLFRGQPFVLGEDLVGSVGRIESRLLGFMLMRCQLLPCTALCRYRPPAE